MFFSIVLHIALATFFLILIYKASTWFAYKFGISLSDVKTSRRISATASGTLATVFIINILQHLINI
jgi:hypothetical protein